MDKPETVEVQEFMRPAAASAYLLSRWGCRAKVQMLAKHRVFGTGPRFRVVGRDIVYERVALDEWGSARLSKQEFTSTSEARSATT